MIKSTLFYTDHFYQDSLMVESYDSLRHQRDSHTFLAALYKPVVKHQNVRGSCNRSPPADRYQIRTAGMSTLSQCVSREARRHRLRARKRVICEAKRRANGSAPPDTSPCALLPPGRPSLQICEPDTWGASGGEVRPGVAGFWWIFLFYEARFDGTPGRQQRPSGGH